MAFGEAGHQRLAAAVDDLIGRRAAGTGIRLDRKDAVAFNQQVAGKGRAAGGVPDGGVGDERRRHEWHPLLL